MTRRVARFTALVGLALGATSLSSCGSTTPATPTPTFTETMDVFGGIIQPLGTDSHTFTVNYAAAASDASITVTSLTTVAKSTPVNITIGVAFGTTNLGVCTPSGISNPAAPLNTELPTQGSPFTAGPYCVQIFDNLNAPTVTEPLNYSLTVRHF